MHSMLSKTILILTAVITFNSNAQDSEKGSPLDFIAEQYVRLALELGEYDKDYVDAFFGPAEWRKEAKKHLRNKKALGKAIQSLYSEIQIISPDDGRSKTRHSALLKNIRAMDTRARMVNGETFSFKEEARLIYDAEIPNYNFKVFDDVLVQINDLMGEPNDLPKAVDDYRNSLSIPGELVTQVVDAAIAECRVRTKKHIKMPDNERFRLEYVTNKNWGGYNWYQGDNESLMQINMDNPMRIDRAVSLGCHEGYPGHHVWNVLVEAELFKQGWVEYSVIPLFSPFGLIAEGSANYGVYLAFPGDEKIAFEKEALYPRANLDPEDAAKLAKLNELTKALAHASTAIAALYLDGEISRDKAIALRQKYSLVSRKKAEQGIRFTEQYRAYVINYTIGKDIIEEYIKQRTSTTEGRWQAFEDVLTGLKTASDMTQE